MTDSKTAEHQPDHEHEKEAPKYFGRKCFRTS